MTQPPLSDEEIRKVRTILLEDERRAWLWSHMRKLVAALFAGAAVLVAFRDDVNSLLDWLFNRGP